LGDKTHNRHVQVRETIVQGAYEEVLQWRKDNISEKSHLGPC